VARVAAAVRAGCPEEGRLHLFTWGVESLVA